MSKEKQNKPINTPTLRVRHTIEDRWDTLSDQDKAEHMLSGSEFWILVKNGRKLAKKVEEMNSGVDEEFQARVPTMYYVDGMDDK